MGKYGFVMLLVVFQLISCGSVSNNKPPDARTDTGTTAETNCVLDTAKIGDCKL